jgi:hypothetical protein
MPLIPLCSLFLGPNFYEYVSVLLNAMNYGATQKAECCELGCHPILSYSRGFSPAGLMAAA